MNNASTSFAPLAELTRGDLAESLHMGSVAVVNANGQLMAYVGDPHAVTFLRSTAKPLQAIPVIESGAADHYDLNEREIAILCGSHGGTTAHIDTVTSILNKIGLTPDALLCGIHSPMAPGASDQLTAGGQSPGPLHNNCSGKHVGMLTLSTYWAHTGEYNTGLLPYTDPAHPVQQAILNTIAGMTTIAPEQIAIGIDGCSVPCFAIPLAATAHAFAQMMAPDTLSPARATAVRRITGAMQTHPDMVLYEGGFDTTLMQKIPGLISKGGAEGYQGIGLAPGILGPDSPAVGIALKVADGSHRARGVIALSILRQLGLSLSASLEVLERPAITNHREITVGQIRPIFELTPA